MNIPLPSSPRGLAALAAAASMALSAAPASAQPRPPAVQALEQHGVIVVGTFPSVGGLQAWAAYRGQTPVALYATPDGKHVIVGSMLDAKGEEVNRAALESAVAKPMTDGAWARVERSHWIPDGSPRAPRVVYVVTDPNCPYCIKLWADARPWVDSGKVQLRHIMVGILSASSAGKAAALLSAKDPAQALTAHARAHVGPDGKSAAAGRPRPLAGGGVKALSQVPADVAAQLDANQQLMATLQLGATPALIWKDAQGRLQTRTGAPDGALAQILGPK